MVKARKTRSFDVEVFLSTVDGGRSVSTYRKGQTVYAQGDPRMPSTTSRRVRLRRLSSPSKERRLWSHFWEPATSSAKGA
jgi:hypothetical protein